MKLFVVEPLGSGGMIHYAYQLSSALASYEDVEVTLVTAREYEMESFPHNFAVEKRMDLWTLFDPKSMQAPPQNQWVARWRKLHWTTRRGLRAMRLIREWIRLTNFLIQAQPDIIQFGKINFPFEAIFLKRLRQSGLTLTQICHEFELRERSGGPLSQIANWMSTAVFDQFSAIFFHAESNRHRFLELFDVPEEQLHIVPHGNESLFPPITAESISEAELRARYDLPADAPVLLFFGTLTPSKGLPDLLKAFTLTYLQHKKARLLIAGYPTKHVDLSAFQQLAAALGISEAVRFDPRYIPFEEVGPLMQMARGVVYPYLNSTQSGALQVAYAFGRPVIVTAVGGLPDVVEEGETGYIVPPANPQELSQAMLKLVRDAELAAQLGARAKQLSETRYAWRPIAGQILEVYRTTVGGAASSPPKVSRDADPPV